MSPDWPKRSTPSGTIGLCGDGAEPRQRRRMEIADGDQRGARPQPRQQPPGDARPARARSAARQSRCSRSGEVIASSPAPRHVLGQLADGRRAPRGRRRRNRRSPVRLRAPARAANRRRRRSPRRGPGRAAASAARPAASTAGNRPTRRPRAGSRRTPSAAAPRARRQRPARNWRAPAGRCPISGSPIDWWAPPSGARVIPDGVATRMKRASW